MRRKTIRTAIETSTLFAQAIRQDALADSGPWPWKRNTVARECVPNRFVEHFQSISEDFK